MLSTPKQVNNWDWYTNLAQSDDFANIFIRRYDGAHHSRLQIFYHCWLIRKLSWIYDGDLLFPMCLQKGKEAILY